MPDHDRSGTATRIAVIGGGANDEHEVSLASAAAVTRAIQSLGFEAVPLTVGHTGGWRHTEGVGLSPADAVAVLSSCRAAFPALHGVHGEDGAVAGLLTMIGVPVVGSPVRAGALGMDKWVTKTLAGAVGIRTAPAVLLRAGDERGPLPLDPPFVVKPTSGGSSNGVSVVRTPGAYGPAVEVARSTGDDVLVESFVRGREVDVAVFRDRGGRLRTGAPLEISVDDGQVFGRAEKYDGTARFTVPARLDTDELAAIEQAARTLYETLGCAGVARFDFFVTDDGVLLNEVNTAPGFTEQSQVPRMFAAVGMAYVELVGALVDATIPRNEE